jgi:hypothetical protein
VFESDLDAKNTLPYLAYAEPDAYRQLILLKKRTHSSFSRLSNKAEIDKVFNVLGIHNTYAINYRWQKSSAGWTTRKAGWSDRGFPIQPFRYIDFLNVLLGEYTQGTAVALSDKHLSHITNIRIDYDFLNYSGKATIRLTREIQDKLATIGMDVFFYSTGNRGIQALIPLPCPLTIHSARTLWNRLKTYLQTDLAMLDKCSIDSYLRLPLGIHATSNCLGLFLSPETEAYVSHIDQLRHFMNSWQWIMPTHINNAIDEDAFGVQAEKEFSFIPEPVSAVMIKTSQSKLPTDDTWANKVWSKGENLRPGEWESFLFDDHALHASYVLHGDEACIKLEKLAERIPARQTSDIHDRIKRVRHLWKTFNPVRPPKDSSKNLAVMLTTRVSEKTRSEANDLFAYIQKHKTPHTRWINEFAYDYIVSVLHGINCCGARELTITIDELLQYMHQAPMSEMSRRTLLRIISKSTQPPPPIRTRTGLVGSQVQRNNLAVFVYDSGKKIISGATPGSYSRIPGLINKVLTDVDEGKIV